MVGAALPISLKYEMLGAFRKCWSFLRHGSDIGVMMQYWVTAASELPDTHDVHESVVHSLLEMAFDEGIRPHIPVVAWEWLKKRPALNHGSSVLWDGGSEQVVQVVRTLGDIELIMSYLFVIWSEWNALRSNDCEGMQRLIREELNGVRAARCRVELIQRLDYILSQLDQGRECLYPRGWNVSEAEFLQVRQHYERFRRDLLELDKEAAQVLAGMSPWAASVARFCLLTMSVYRISFHLHVCSSTSLSIAAFRLFDILFNSFEFTRIYILESRFLVR